MAVMPNGEFKEISLADFKGKYVCLFFYPLDFTYVCPSEIVSIMFSPMSILSSLSRLLSIRLRVNSKVEMWN